MSKSSRRPSREARKKAPGNRLNREERIAAKHKRSENLAKIREKVKATGSSIEPRTQACNRKSASTTLEEQQSFYEDTFAAQIQAWRPMLPVIIKHFSKIKDPREIGKIKHSLPALLLLGLFMFIFRLPSRRALNSELTEPVIHSILHELFPEIDSIPHADTLSRILSRVDIIEIEEALVNMVRTLIRKKKFRRLLVQGCIPIAIDGTQKIVRNGQLQEDGWLMRTVITKEGEKQQQYVYVLEANVTFLNGLTIPLLTEYCYLDAEDESNSNIKQDCEINGFNRLSNRLKKYFPLLKVMILLDSLYACESVISFLKKKRWEFVIKLPSKLKQLYELLATNRGNGTSIPGQPYYRERKQVFHWVNNADYKGNGLHLVGCLDSWESIDDETQDIIKKHSEHTWISSIKLSINNIHEICNLAGRKRFLIEDSFNTEKNRGYQYQHVFSYNWNAMQGFHYLMRLAHAINAISEFTKGLKKYITNFGWAKTLTTIFDAAKHNWLWECQKTCVNGQNKIPSFRGYLLS